MATPICKMGMECEKYGCYAATQGAPDRCEIPLTQESPAPVNQCDGCQAGVPVDEKGYHRMGKPGEYADLMYCERKRYVSEPAPAQAK